MASDAGLVRLVAAAFTEGFAEGQKDFTTNKGGKSWPDVKAKYEPKIAALLAAARAEERERAAKVADASADACRQRKREALHPIDGVPWSQQETAARTIAAAIRGGSHGE